jgi:hypothetical protein
MSAVAVELPSADLSAAAELMDKPRLPFAGLAVAAGGLALAGFADTIGTRNRWRGDMEIMDFAEGDASGEQWLVLPGHGEHDPAPLLSALGEGAMSGTRLAGCQYSLNGFKLPEVGEKIYQKYATGDPEKRLNLFCNSMGGITFFEAMNALPDEQRQVMPKIDRLVLNSSPFDVEDLKDGKIVNTLNKLPYQGEVLGKLANIMIRDWQSYEPGFTGVMNGVRHGLRETFDGVSPRTLIGQTHVLALANLPDKAEACRSLVDEDTQAVYCMAGHEGADRRVYDRQAFAKWQSYLSGFGVKLDRLAIENGVHADYERASVELQPWIARTSPDAWAYSAAES